MNKREFRPLPSADEPQYPTHELVDRDRRAFLEQCGAALAGLTALALMVDLTGLDDGDPRGTRNKKKPGKKKPGKKKPGKKKPGKKKPPPMPIPGGPRHPPAPPDPVPPKKKTPPKP